MVEIVGSWREKRGGGTARPPGPNGAPKLGRGRETGYARYASFFSVTGRATVARGATPGERPPRHSHPAPRGASGSSHAAQARDAPARPYPPEPPPGATERLARRGECAPDAHLSPQVQAGGGRARCALKAEKQNVPDFLDFIEFLGMSTISRFHRFPRITPISGVPVTLFRRLDRHANSLSGPNASMRAMLARDESSRSKPRQSAGP